MGCACEDGSRESFKAAVLTVVDKEAGLASVEKIRGKIPESLYQETLKKLNEVSSDKFSVTLMQYDGGLVGEMSVSGDLLPQPKEWFKARVGKMIHVVMTQLANRHGGGLSMDVHDVEDNLPTVR